MCINECHVEQRAIFVFKHMHGSGSADQAASANFIFSYKALFGHVYSCFMANLLKLKISGWKRMKTSRRRHSYQLYSSPYANASQCMPFSDRIIKLSNELPQSNNFSTLTDFNLSTYNRRLIIRK